MSAEFCYLLYLLWCGATGDKLIAPTKAVDWDIVFKIAQIQGVSAIIAYAIKNSDIEVPSNIRAKAITTLRSTAYNVTIRKCNALELLHKFEVAGIPAIVLKGFAIAEYYAIPESRASGDIDVLVSEQTEEISYTLLQENGFVVRRRSPMAHEAACDHPQIGHFELHVKLFGETVGQSVFSDISFDDIVRENKLLMNTQDGQYYTLGYTDHMLFLIIHFMKHLISSGANLRSYMDVVLYYYQNREHIDTDRLITVLRKAKAEVLFSTMLASFVIYGNAPEDINEAFVDSTEDKCNELLYDIAQCDGMNFGEKTRTQSGDAIVQSSMIANKGYVRYLSFRAGQFFYNTFSAIFAPVGYMKIRFKYLRKYPFLLPFAWCERMVRKGISAVRRGALNTHIVRLDSLSGKASRRVKMFKKMGMM